MSGGDHLRGLTFAVPGLHLGVAHADDERYALALVLGGAAERCGDGDELQYYIGGVDLSLARAGRAPVLQEHRWRLEEVLGAVADAWLEGDALHCLLRVARGGEASRVWDLLSGGFPVAISAGLELIESVAIGPSRYGGTSYKVTRSRLMEVSAVARGRDPAACAWKLDPADLSQLVERVGVAEDAAKSDVRRRLHLDRWERWSLTAGIRIAQEMDVHADRLSDALAREVAAHAVTLEQELATPTLKDAARAA